MPTPPQPADPKSSFYVTTPIYYVNDAPHVGHCYTTLLADCLARAHRLLGDAVFFLTGTDEHAEKVVTAAAERGLAPQAWADRNAAAFREAFDAMGLAYDDFIRTSEPRHKAYVTARIAELQERGDVYLGEYAGWWDPSQEEYLTETAAREAEFKSPVSGAPLEQRTERNYFFRLEKYAARLEKHITDNPSCILPAARRNEVLGRIKQGLKDIPISRAVPERDAARAWGVRMPGDDAHRVYVWIDALFNYLTAVEAPREDAPPAPGFRGWPADVHFIAKDILWFHAVVWPCMLMALGKQPPGRVYAHSYWIREGRKMSKSLGNFIDTPTLLAYRDAYSLDALRWHLVTQGPMGAADADFAHAKFVEVVNADLANGVGNAFSRVSNMIAKYFDGAAPAPGAAAEIGGFDLSADARRAVETCVDALRACDLPGAFGAGLALTRRVDAMIHQTEPFKLAKDPAKLDTVGAILHHCAEALRIAAVLLWPVMPEKCAELLRRMGQDPAELGAVRFEELTAWGRLRPGTAVQKGQALFPRIDAAAEPPLPAPAASGA